MWRPWSDPCSEAGVDARHSAVSRTIPNATHGQRTIVGQQASSQSRCGLLHGLLRLLTAFRIMCRSIFSRGTSNSMPSSTVPSRLIKRHWNCHEGECGAGPRNYPRYCVTSATILVKIAQPPNPKAPRPIKRAIHTGHASCFY